MNDSVDENEVGDMQAIVVVNGYVCVKPLNI